MRKCFLLLSLFLSYHSMAAVPVDQMVAICKPYPEIKSSAPIPKNFYRNNNLSRPANSAFYQADGEKIVIYGRLMDSNCVPISDGHIYIWQSNKNGYYQYSTKASYKPKWIDPNFTGTGSTNSDNLGRFNFITIKPGSRGKVTPHINFKIEHSKLKTLSSKIYFPSSESDYIHDSVVIKKQDKIARVSAVLGEKDSTGVTTYFIDITLNQVIEGKEY